MTVCDIETGQSNVILDINESQGQRKFFLFCLLGYVISHAPRMCVCVCVC